MEMFFLDDVKKLIADLVVHLIWGYWENSFYLWIDVFFYWYAVRRLKLFYAVIVLINIGFRYFFLDDNVSSCYFFIC